MAEDIETIGLDETSRAVIQQLVEEKRRLLEAAAPRVSLQDYIQGGPDVLQQNVEIMRDAVAAPAIAAPAVAWGEASKEVGQAYLHAGLTPREKAVLQEQADLRAAMAVAVAVQEGASWVAESQPAEWATGAGLPHEPPAQGDEEPSAEPQEPGAAPEPPPEPREACAGSERSACSGSQAPLLHRSSEAAQQRAARLQQELYLREMRECTFRPRINRRGGAPSPHGASEDFVERAQRWREEREREQEERRRQKEQAVSEECPFRPSLAPRAPAAPAATPAAAKAGGSGEGEGAKQGVVKRLYHPHARQALDEAQRQARERQQREEEAECSFKPQTNRPTRTNAAATSAKPRYRQPSPRLLREQREREATAAGKPDATSSGSGVSQADLGRPPPLPSGQEHCTFSPRVNRVPPRLSAAAAQYLEGDAYSRLSTPRGPPTPRALLSSTSATEGKPLRRSASAPRQRTPAAAEREAGWGEFHARQESFKQRKSQAEEKRQRAAAAAAYQPPELSSGTRRLSERARQRGAAERRPSLGGASAPFLQRVSASAASRASERSLGGGHGPAPLPSHEQEHCTFAPRITEAAHRRRGRTVAEMSDGDRLRKEQAAERRRVAAELRAEGEHTFKPTINAVPGVQSRLKVASEPESYLARVQQHMRLKEKVTECVRAAEEARLMRECTFHPETHEAPAYVSRIAKSMALAKAGREPEAPERPGWR